jgi:copper chaperone CopZ
VPDLMLWLTKPDEGGAPSLEDVGGSVGRLGYVSEVDVRTEGGVVHVSFEGGKAEQEEIEGTIRETGYEIFKVSHRERKR